VSNFTVFIFDKTTTPSKQMILRI